MHRWQLDPDVIQLNHGSFGATPIAILEEQRRWRDRLESNPTRFILTEYEPALDAARNATAEFLGASPDGIVFVPSATTGVNSVLLSLEPQLGPGDEIVVLDHTYNACRNAADVTALRTGATVVTAVLPFPVGRPSDVVEAVVSKVTDRTKLVMVDWITSTSAIVLPVAEIVAQLEPEVPVLVDAAHGPGQVPMALDDLGASFVTGNAHKWMCAAKGVAVLHVRADHRDIMRPSTISHGWNQPPPHRRSMYQRLFDVTGTDDPSGRLSMPRVIEVMAAMDPDGWPGVMAANHDLAVAGRDIVCERIGAGRPVPDTMLGAMAVVPLPVEPFTGELHPLWITLRDRWSIEVPVYGRPDGMTLLRLSAQRYNRISDYERLADALAKELT